MQTIQSELSFGWTMNRVC